MTPADTSPALTPCHSLVRNVAINVPRVASMILMPKRSWIGAWGSSPFATWRMIDRPSSSSQIPKGKTSLGKGLADGSGVG